MSTETSSAAPAATEAARCPDCKTAVFEDERYCEACGRPLVEVPAHTLRARPGTSSALTRVEIDLGVIAAVADRGHRRPRNEDAVALARRGVRCAAALCDGVASTADAHLAAAGASRAAIEVLERALELAPWPDLSELFNRAFDAAQHAVAGVPVAAHGDQDASTTLIAAVTRPGQVAVANIGDCRAYWLEPGTAGRLMTVDDSWAELKMREGVSRERALADPEAHTITRWLGADAESVVPTVTVGDVDRPGVLLLCSDGLWNYFARPDQLAGLLFAKEADGPLEQSRRLVRAALDAGGADNVAVAVLPVDGPTGGRPDRSGAAAGTAEGR
jgi:serine/threonine protein phosphatase PrpC